MAQCHNHKFDPITQEDYYCLQAVFAAVDRADRSYYADPAVDQQHSQLLSRQRKLTDGRKEIELRIRSLAGVTLTELDNSIQQLTQQLAAASDVNRTPHFGYHSAISPGQDSVKWVQVDLGESIPLQCIVVRPAFDNFNGIGAGFGFPLRFRVETSEQESFLRQVTLVADHQHEDVQNPGVELFEWKVDGRAVRYIRVTATKLASRQNDFILALAELQAFDASGQNRALPAVVTSLDSIEAAPRWGRSNLVDGNWPEVGLQQELALLKTRRDRLWKQHASVLELESLSELDSQLADVARQLDELPDPDAVYVATVHHGAGAFAGTGSDGGRPRVIHLLNRGDITKPGAEVGPGTLEVFADLPGRFQLPSEHAEGDRRAALARLAGIVRKPPDMAEYFQSSLAVSLRTRFGRNS